MRQLHHIKPKREQTQTEYTLKHLAHTHDIILTYCLPKEKNPRGYSDWLGLDFTMCVGGGGGFIAFRVWRLRFASHYFQCALSGQIRTRFAPDMTTLLNIVASGGSGMYVHWAGWHRDRELSTRPSPSHRQAAASQPNGRAQTRNWIVVWIVLVVVVVVIAMQPTQHRTDTILLRLSRQSRHTSPDIFDSYHTSQHTICANWVNANCDYEICVRDVCSRRGVYSTWMRTTYAYPHIYHIKRKIYKHVQPSCITSVSKRQKVNYTNRMDTKCCCIWDDDDDLVGDVESTTMLMVCMFGRNNTLTYSNGANH